jgi:hypothetical protein
MAQGDSEYLEGRGRPVPVAPTGSLGTDSGGYFLICENTISLNLLDSIPNVA